jgi:large subunit ribosomal protein L24e
MVIKTDLCAFSGLRIWPGHGLRYVPASSVQTTRPVFPFVHKKARALFQRRRNPRVISWTQLYRRQHKKGNVEQLKKARKRKLQKVERGFTGASIEFINAQRNQTQEQRKQIRLSTKKALEEKKKKLTEKKTEQAKKLEEAKKNAKKGGKQQQQKIIPKKQAQAPKAKFTQTR